MPDPADATPESPDLNRILIQIMARVTEFLEVERSTLFVFDEEKGELWSPVAQGAASIRVPRGRGIAAQVFETGETIRLADAYADPRFNGSVDKQTGFRTRDIFCRPINDSAGRRIGVIQLLNRRAGPLTARDETLLDAICGQAGVAIENAQLFLRLKKESDAQRELHGQLESNHTELQRAFLKIEESATVQVLLGRRIQRVRLISLVTGVALFVAVGLFAWLGTGQKKPVARPIVTGAPLAWHTVATAPVRTGIALLGNIEPLEVRNLTAPFRGRIAEKNFEYGELVTKDQVLARMDPTEVEVELRNGEAALFKATAELKRLETWAKSPEVARAERSLIKARLSFEANQRNLREMEQLSGLGIIALASLDSARQQFATQEADFQSAKEELNNVLATATPDRITTARYDVENTRLRIEELRGKLAKATLRAPFSGIVILPNTRPTAGRAAGNDGFYEQGMSINQSEILLAIGNLEGVAVKTRADEIDIARIRHDQAVVISGDGFAPHSLRGRVAYLSSQAVVSGARPYFDIVVRTGPLSPAELAAVRLGMSARLDITVYEAPAALVVPVSAVRRNAGGAVVFRRGNGEQPESVPVTTGVVLADRVEIRSGLKAGDVIATQAKAVTP